MLLQRLNQFTWNFMEKQKRWQFVLILAVIILTVYNILPTVFYYAQPLKEPVDAARAEKIELAMAERVNSLEQDALDFLKSFCKELNVKPTSIELNKEHPEKIAVVFSKEEDAKKFRTFLPRAGSLISFVPSQLSLDSSLDGKTVTVLRRIPLHFTHNQLNSFFQFSKKKDEAGKLTEFYRLLIQDRAAYIGSIIGGISETAEILQLSWNNRQDPQAQEVLSETAQNIVSFVSIFGENSPIARQYFSSFTQTESSNKPKLVQNFISSLESLKDSYKLERIGLQQEQQNGTLSLIKSERLNALLTKEATLSSALLIVQKHATEFAAGESPLDYTTLAISLQNGENKILLGAQNPFFKEMTIHWNEEKLSLLLQPDLLHIMERSPALKPRIDQLIFNEVSRIARQTGEELSPYQEQFHIALSNLNSSNSFVAMRLSTIAQSEINQLKASIEQNFHPKSSDLARERFPIYSYEEFQKLPLEKQKLGLVLYAPALSAKKPPQGFRMNSIYLIGKGMDALLQKTRTAPDSEEARHFMQDFESLYRILQQNGFTGYSGNYRAFANQFSHDFIFEQEGYFQTLLKATREDFSVHGTKRFAVLELSNLEQRILTENKIDTRIHEDLHKWRDDYLAAKLRIHGASPYDVPAPSKSVFWNNLKLSSKKYFRGDERKILHWGLDLSGGKSVQIELRDSNNQRVTNDADLTQGINELYTRVNKMGVSEVTIRQEGSTISLDFPGSQNLSAAELIRASSMYFHIVNEKFNEGNKSLAESATHFLQDVWNEAVVTNRKTSEEINEIARKQLYGDSLDMRSVQPRSSAAKILYDNGLRLGGTEEGPITGLFATELSKIALYRGDDYTDWHGQTHPLLIVFRNFAIEGSNLEDVSASYDPSRGNYLSFGIQNSQAIKERGNSNPRDNLFAWSSQFAKETVLATANGAYTSGRGWRMAVILNGTVVTAPTLESGLRDKASITGSFTQREINQLEADLKAGSLSFTPHILSEKNVSPELGSHERALGIIATAIALVLVCGLMISYYRFGGLVASVALLFNLLIMWATLQNLQATMTLAGIAGIILTLGMAVDANVLVFERIREEFIATGRIASAIHAGYKKAFTAIVDSNLTTIIAALILLNFDSGPIKAFAVMLIIGIISSMFSALFMTRYFFAGWVQNPEHKKLDMACWIKNTKFNFLKCAKKTVIISALIIVAGGALLIKQRETIFGMDFTGGFAVTLQLQTTPSDIESRQAVENALIKAGITKQEVQIRELSSKNSVRLFLAPSLEKNGRPFYQMPLATTEQELGFGFESNPRLVWIVNVLQANSLFLETESLQTLDQDWTAISGQISDSMRNNAVIGLVLALIAIMIYITARFEFKYAISATLCTAHDVIFTIAAIALLHYFGIAIQIDLNTVAALMTIIGYSLNDTIIVFDRIREDVHLMRRKNFSDIINHALNVTLSRTLMTSGTTLLVLIPLIALGGSTIFGFALVMSIGVVFGTLSSLFIAAPLMQYFHHREEKKGEVLEVLL